MIKEKMISLVLACAFILSLLSVTVSAAGERAEFNTGSSVSTAWKNLAGSKDKVTEIRQYSGRSLPENIQTQIISSSTSELPIYSWYDNGIIYYWSEDSRPYTNKDASYMFNGFTKATFIDVSHFDTSRTEDMESMFANCTSVETLDIRGFDTSNVRCMYCMFIYDSKLENLDLSHFNTRNVTRTSDGNYGSMCGMFIGCSGLTKLDLSSFDMTAAISYPYNVQNMFVGCTSLEKLILGPKVRFNSYTALSGSWTHEGDNLTLGGSALCSQYNNSNALLYSGTWIRNMPEGHYYKTDGSLGQNNLWEVHTPGDRFKGYCLNLHRFGVGEELDRVLAEDDTEIVKLLCSESEGSVHGFAPIGSSMREVLITLIYYGWANDAANIQRKYGLSDQEYLEITQNAIWDYTDRYNDPAGPTLYSGNSLKAYNELVSQRYSNIEGKYILFLYKSWDKNKQNLLSIMGVDDQEYGGVAVRKQNANGSENLAGAVFTVYDIAGNEVGNMTTSANGVAYICRTDHTVGLPLGEYTVRETTPPAGYEPSDVEYHFNITEANHIVTEGWRSNPTDPNSTITEEMIFFDEHDDSYVGGGIGIIKQSNSGKMLAGAEFTIYNDNDEPITTLITNDAGIAASGKQDLPLGTYIVKETAAPGGYILDSTPQTVTITENFQFITLTFLNAEKKGSIQLRAQKNLKSETHNIEAGQFTFQLLDDHYNVIQTAANNEDGSIVFDTIEYTPDDLGYKNYHIVEVIGDDTDILYDRYTKDVTVTIYDTDEGTLRCTAIYGSDGATFTNKEGAKRFEINILKKKLNTNLVLEGAVLEILDVSNRLICSWVSSGEAHSINLEPGVYKLREIKAPNGYYETSDIIFEIQSDGTISASKSQQQISVDDNQITVWDSSIPSTKFEFFKVDADTNENLGGASFKLESLDRSYSATSVTESDGKAVFEGLETGTYLLTETEAPKGYYADNGPWKVEVLYDRAISKSANINASGSATGNYSNEEIRDAITIPGSPESIHVELKYQTEDGYDYLELLDKYGNVITEDINGSPIGDTREAYKGRLWGGMDNNKVYMVSYDLPGDSVTFHFVPDANTAAYGYYAVVTSESKINITDKTGKMVVSEDGEYKLKNRQVVTVSGEKTWQDDNDRDGKRPKNITIHLFADGIEVSSKTVNKDDGWKWSFNNLDKYKDGAEIEYTISEDAVDDYITKIDGFNVTNIHEPENTWEDNDNDVVDGHTDSFNANTHEFENTLVNDDIDAINTSHHKASLETGDDGYIDLWINLMCVSIFGLAVIELSRRKRKYGSSR